MAPRLLGGDESERCVLATATQDGAPRALLHFVPWGTRGLSLDLISRDRTAPSGLAELLVAEVIRRAPELGVQRISLNFAAFRPSSAVNAHPLRLGTLPVRGASGPARHRRQIRRLPAAGGLRSDYPGWVVVNSAGK